MKDDFDSEPGPLHERDAPLESHPPSENPYAVGQPLGGPQNHAQPPPAKFDAWLAVNLLAHRWLWLMFGGIFGAVGFYFLGGHMIHDKFTASAQLMRYDSSSGPNDPINKNLSAETFVGFIRSPI